MKKLTDICKQIANKIKAEMDEALEFRCEHVTKELLFGTAWVVVEIGRTSVNGWLLPYSYVTVYHEDVNHQSPLLEDAIKQALPTWDEVEKEYNSTFERNTYLL